MADLPDVNPVARATAHAYEALAGYLRNGNCPDHLRRRYEWALTELAFAADCLGKAARELQTEPPQPTA